MRYLKAFNEQHESDWYTKLPEVIDECGDILLDLKDELLFNVEINLDLDNLIIWFNNSNLSQCIFSKYLH